MVVAFCFNRCPCCKKKL